MRALFTFICSLIAVSEAHGTDTLVCQDPAHVIQNGFCDTLMVKQDTSIVVFKFSLPTYLDSNCYGVDPRQHPECSNPQPDSTYLKNMRAWSHEIFSAFELWDYNDPSVRLHAPSDSASRIAYHLLRAKRSTIISLSKKPFVTSVDRDQVNVTMIRITEGERSASGQPISEINALGKRINPTSKLRSVPEYRLRK